MYPRLIPAVRQAAIPQVRRARRLRSRLRAAIAHHGLILMYHRIARPASDPWKLAVSPEHFAEQMDVLSQHGPVVPLARFADPATLEPRQLAVTFDDAYRDNLEAALPVLDRAGTPATVFAVSGAIGSERDYWWDALARLFLEAPVLPDLLNLEAEGHHVRHILAEAATLSAADRGRLARWDAVREAPPHPRARLFLEVWRPLSSMAPSRAEAITSALMSWGKVARAGLPGDRVLDADALRQLADAGPVEIGGHTISHIDLASADPETAMAEIRGSRTALSAMLDRDVGLFAYPFGRHDRAVTPRLVRDAGFRLACTTREAIVHAGADPWRLPRVTVPDVGGEDFAQLLHDLTGR